MAWTVAIAAAAIAAGIAASSIALIGLGLDSAIGLLAAAIVICQLRSGRARRSHAGVWAAPQRKLQCVTGARQLRTPDRRNRNIYRYSSHLRLARRTS